MRPGLFLIFLCFVQCNGAPPKEGGATSKSRPRYTDEEDKFILEEISRLISSNKRIFGNYFWYDMARQHSEKLKQKTPGFSHERSSESLRSRLKDVLVFNHPHVNVKVPESLMRRFPQLDIRQQPKAIRHPYTKEEEEFIINELLKPSCITMHGQPTRTAIRAQHDLKRKHGTLGFDHARTDSSLRSHVTRMQRKGQLPPAVLEKFGLAGEGASSSGPTPSNQQTDHPVTEIGPDDDQWIDEWIEELREDPEMEIRFSNGKSLD